MRLSDRPTERSTAATDALLSLAAAAGIVWLQVLASLAPGKLHLWSWTFGLIALAAALGAVYHGLVLAERSRIWLWRILTVCLSTAISLFGVGMVWDAFGAEAAARALPVLLLSGVLIYAVSRAFAGLFIVFIVYQALVLALALGAYAWLAARGAPAGAGWMAAGVGASMIAAAVQTARNLQVKLIWTFDHNAIFHLIQISGVILFCVGLSRG
jgi:hypothetical protein